MEKLLGDIDNVLDPYRPEAAGTVIMRSYDLLLDKTEKVAHKLNTKFLPDLQRYSVPAVIFARAVCESGKWSSKELPLEALGHLLMQGAKEQITRFPDAAQALGAVIRFYGAQLREAGAKVPEAQYLYGLQTMRHIIARYSPSAQHLTSAHSYFMLFCVLSGRLSLARRFYEDHTVLDVNPKVTGCAPIDYLTYFYYAGVALMGCDRWQQAQRALRIAIATPAEVLSAVMIAATKKYLLCGIICSGRLATLPRTSGSQERDLKRHCSVYFEFATMFERGWSDKVIPHVRQHRDAFAADGNLALVQRCVSSWDRLQVMKLTKTYRALTVADLSSMVSTLSSTSQAPEKLSAERIQQILLPMVEQQLLNCECSGSAPATSQTVVSFKNVDESESKAELLEGIHSAQHMLNRIQRADEQLTSSFDYTYSAIGKRPDLRQVLAEYEKQLKEAQVTSNSLGGHDPFRKYEHRHPRPPSGGSSH